MAWLVNGAVAMMMAATAIAAIPDADNPTLTTTAAQTARVPNRAAGVTKCNRSIASSMTATPMHDAATMSRPRTRNTSEITWAGLTIASYPPFQETGEYQGGAGTQGGQHHRQ